MIFSLILGAALAFTDADAVFAYKKAAEFTEKYVPRDAGTLRAHLAANWILDQVAMVGGDVHLERFTDITPKGERRFINIVYEFKGAPEKPWVELVSHYDTKRNVPGANDGASTTALLIALCAIVEREDKLSGNLRIVWTDGEECEGLNYAENDGFHGSKHEASRLKALERKVRAVICLDMLGDKDLQIVIPANSDVRLAKIAELCAKKTPELPPGIIKRSERKVLDDHDAFTNLGFNSMLLIDSEYGSQPGLNDYWHTIHDTIDKISSDSLKKSGKLVTAILCDLL